MDLPDYYAILHIPRSAGAVAIRRAYRARARAWHPDANGGSAAAEAQMKRLNEARDVLLDPERRRAYDAWLAARAIAGNRASESSGSAARGYDASATITISDEEARSGTVRPLSFHSADGRPYTIAVTVPPGTAYGARLRLKGRGGPSRDGTQRGDLYVTIVIDVDLPPARDYAVSPPHETDAGLLERLVHWVRQMCAGAQ